MIDVFTNFFSEYFFRPRLKFISPFDPPWLRLERQRIEMEGLAPSFNLTFKKEVDIIKKEESNWGGQSMT
jgi:hypothetical protein